MADTYSLVNAQGTFPNTGAREGTGGCFRF
jgi:hypothetical protein